MVMKQIKFLMKDPTALWREKFNIYTSVFFVKEWSEDIQ